MSDLDQIQSGTVKVLINNVLTELQRHYPLYSAGWYIKVDNREKGGIMVIQNHYLSGDVGITLHLNKIDPELKCVVNGAGELLERFRQSRAKAGSIRDRLDELRVNRIGKAVYDT